MNMSKSSIGRIRTLAAGVFGFLALCLCYAGAVSYGGSARLTPLNVTALPHFYPTFGTPNDALVTADDAYVIVSVSGTDLCTDESCAGVQVFRKPDFTNPCGGQQILYFPRPQPHGPPIQAADGMHFFSGSPQVSVGAAVEARGAEFFRLASLNEPCAIDGIVNVPQLPAIPNCPNPQHLCPPGTFDVAVTPDGQYAFVANEYGLMPSPTPATEKGGGTIGIIRTRRDDAGRFTHGTRSIEQNNTIYIPGGDTIPGITMSHDGRYLYVTCEGSAEGYYPASQNHIRYRDPTNIERDTRNPNAEVLCPGCSTGNDFCDNESKGTLTRNGLLAVIDVDKAIRGEGQNAIIRIIASGCSPVRAVETADGRHLFVAARGKNTYLPIEPGTSAYEVLVFDVSTLVSDHPNDALVGHRDSGGTAPVGMALFGNDDSLLAVANSNRFYYNCECTVPRPPHEGCFVPRDTPPCTANVAILDVSNRAAPTVQQRIRNAPNAFPRNVTLGPDGSTLYVPNANAEMLEVITTNVGSQKPH
jgi:DNA-binding beta-propeller fold protein YncE